MHRVCTKDRSRNLHGVTKRYKEENNEHIYEAKTYIMVFRKSGTCALKVKRYIGCLPFNTYEFTKLPLLL